MTVEKYDTVIVIPANRPHSMIFLAFVVMYFFLILPILVFTLMKSAPSIPPKTPRLRAPWMLDNPTVVF